MQLVSFHDLLKKQEETVSWTTDLEKAFHDIKNHVVNACVLDFPKQGAPLRLVTDASDIGIGAVLEQFSPPYWRPLGFFSRKLSGAPFRYSTFDKELLAIHEGLKYFHHLV